MDNNLNEMQENTTPETTQQQDNDTPSVEELQALLAKERAEKAKLKASFDRSSSEAADYKKRLRAKQTAEETEAEAQREEMERLRTENENFKKQKALSDATNRFISIGMSVDMAKEAAQKETDGDLDGVTMLYQKHTQSVIESKKAEWLASRPEINSGGKDQNEAEEIKKAFFGR